jgi:hypothetical protein
VGRAVHAQASTLAVVALALGVPLGIMAGRLAFRAFANGLGFVPDPTTPPLLVLVTVAAVLGVANLTATWPARRARHTAVARLLRTE